MRGSIIKRKGCKTYSIVISQKDEGGSGDRSGFRLELELKRKLRHH